MDSSYTWLSSLPPSAALAITFAVASFLVFAASLLQPARAAVLPGPARTALTPAAKEELEQLVGGNSLPGARDVETPIPNGKQYGSIRVYEFGPEDGKKVLLVHGISTSSMTLEPIAKSLSSSGCRVMLFDLFGRGLSDGVGDVPHDPRLYITQILLVLASSPLAWTGTRNAFNLVGYSLGGGIAVHFANTFPHLVSSLVLLAPAGLIRAESFGITRHIFTSGFVPEFILSKLTARRLQTPIASSKTARAIAEADNTPAKLAEAEAADPPNGESVTPLEQRVLKYVRWMVRNHSGFVPAFMSSIRHAPLVDQHESWAKLSRRDSGSTIVMLARSDEIINVNEYTEVGLPLVGGKDHVVWEVLPGGHDFVMTHSPDIVRILDREWEL